jgi:hypothetical protein
MKSTAELYVFYNSKEKAVRVSIDFGKNHHYIRNGYSFIGKITKAFFMDMIRNTRPSDAIKKYISGNQTTFL